MKERPILFGGEMVRAIFEGRKTQTRRVVKPQPYRLAPFGRNPDSEAGDLVFGMRTGDGLSKLRNPSKGSGAASAGELYAYDYESPYGSPGDRLYVRETWAVGARWDDTPPSELPKNAYVYYGADGISGVHLSQLHRGRWRPSIHMPKRVSRTMLEVVSVRVERLQDITEEDAIAEGITQSERTGGWLPGNCVAPEWAFHELWDQINGSRGYGWEKNPWVWVVTFKVADA